MPCKHNNVQDYSEMCLDCGMNIYASPDEIIKDLKRKRKEIDIEIAEMEVEKIRRRDD